MPTYSYRCPECAHEYDAFQKITDSMRTKCPRCGTRGERRITGGAGIHFKGSGFYVTDYGRAGKKEPPKDEGGDKATGEKEKKATGTADGTKSPKKKGEAS